jgi:hypothetical protein
LTCASFQSQQGSFQTIRNVTSKEELMNIQKRVDFLPEKAEQKRKVEHKRQLLV